MAGRCRDTLFSRRAPKALAGRCKMERAMVRKPGRPGQIHTAWLAFLASVAILAGLVGLLFWDHDRPFAGAAPEPLVVYCAAGIKAPVEAVARDYEKAYGVRVQPQYGGSQTLLANLEVGRSGDLYLPADDSYIHLPRG